jgi:hypothetical protein
VVFVRYLNGNSLLSMQFNSTFESTKVLVVNPNFLFITIINLSFFIDYKGNLSIPFLSDNSINGINLLHNINL